MIYLASPYTHHDVFIRRNRYAAALAYTAARLLRGESIFSPIVYGHQFVEFGMGTDAHSWKNFNHKMIQQADEVRVLMLPGWDESYGVAEEIKYANYHSYATITYVEPAA